MSREARILRDSIPKHRRLWAEPCWCEMHRDIDTLGHEHSCRLQRYVLNKIDPPAPNPAKDLLATRLHIAIRHYQKAIGVKFTDATQEAVVDNIIEEVQRVVKEYDGGDT